MAGWWGEFSRPPVRQSSLFSEALCSTCGVESVTSALARTILGDSAIDFSMIVSPAV